MTTFRSAGVIHQYEMKDYIGYGSYSRVYKAIIKETKEEVTLKKLLVEAETLKEYKNFTPAMNEAFLFSMKYTI